MSLKGENDMASCIAKIELENLTYTIPGGFNVAPYSNKLGLWELPRAQSFKGLWRWWLRVLLSGALWKSGKYDMRKVQQMIGNLLGSTDQASKFIIHVSSKGRAQPVNAQIIKKYKRLRGRLTITPSTLLTKLPPKPGISPLPPRLSLLLLARESDELLAEKISCYQPGDLKITIELLKRPYIAVNFEEYSVTIAALLLSLIFGGVGAITRRGFGALAITSIELRKDLKKYEDIISGIEMTNEPSSIRILLTKLIQESILDAQRLLSVKGVAAFNEISDLPLLSEPGDPPEDIKPFNLSILKLLVPNIVNNEKEIFDLLGYRDYEGIKFLTIIGYSTTKLFWKLIDGEDYRIPGFTYNTWVMGLPRGQRLHGQKTGYWLNDELGRRVSVISIKPIKRLERNSWIISLSGFLSKDWDRELYHYGIYRYGAKRRKITPHASIDKAFIEAWIKLKKIYGVK